MITREQARDTAGARHADIRHATCPERENRGLSSYPRATDVEAEKKSWPTG